jgi:hypothetical protein
MISDLEGVLWSWLDDSYDLCLCVCACYFMHVVAEIPQGGKEDRSCGFMYDKIASEGSVHTTTYVQ